MRSTALVLTGVLSAFGLAAPLGAVTCTPVSATLCVGIDDVADVWINGQCVAAVCNDYFVYVDGSSPNPIACVSVDPSILNASGNYVAVRVRNTAPTEMWGTWSLDILCAGGFHAYVTSNDNFDFYHDASGTTPPPLDGSGRAWTDPAYTPLAPWGAPATVAGSVYGKRASDPATGQLLPPKSWDSSGSGSGPDIMYFRQGFGLTPVPTPVPPSMTVTLASSVCAMQGNTPFDITVHLCNTGGAVTTTVQAVLHRDPQVSFFGPWSPVGFSISDSGNDTTLTLPGFGANTCADYVLQCVDYYIGPAEVGSIRNFSVDLSYPGGTDSSGIAIPAVNCVALSPTITRTFTPTPPPLPTDTVSPTPAPPTATFSITPSFTDSPTPAPTATVTPSGTPPPTPTISQTYTPLPTPTDTPEPLLLTPKYPNPSPAKDAVWLPYIISADADVNIRIYDISGERVLDMGPLFQLKGAHERRWELVNQAGTQVASGIYLCHILAKSPDNQEDEVWVKVAVSR